MASVTRNESKSYVEFIPTSLFEAFYWWTILPFYSVSDCLKKRAIKIYREDIMKVFSVKRLGNRKTWHCIEYRERGVAGEKDRHGFFQVTQVPDDILTLSEKQISAFEYTKKYIVLRGLRLLPNTISIFILPLMFLLTLLGPVLEFIFNHELGRRTFGLSNCDLECLKTAHVHVSALWNLSIVYFPFLILPMPLAIFLRRRTRDLNHRGGLIYEGVALTSVGVFAFLEKREPILHALGAAWSFIFRN